MTRLGLFTVALQVASLVVGCSSDPPIHEFCTGIPSGGCPGQGSYNCKDTTCEAIYACDSNNNTWSFVEKCPAYKPPVDAAADVAIDAPSDTASADVHLLDAGFALPDGAAGGAGCEPLEPTDCSVEDALLCADCCGCQDLYVCVAGGWDLWGECGDAGVKPIGP